MEHRIPRLHSPDELVATDRALRSIGSSPVTIVAFEGIDGAGKRTQAQYLIDRAQAVGLTATTLSFPRYQSTSFAGEVARYLTGELGDPRSVDPKFAGVLFAGDRLESRPLLFQAIQDHDLVVLDRYIASNLAYQAAKVSERDRENLIRWLETLEYSMFELPEASVTVLIDIPHELAARRLSQRKVLDGRPRNDIHEADAEYLRNCREIYLSLANRNFRSRWLVSRITADPSLPPASHVADSIWAQVFPILTDMRATGELHH